jgi:type IV pilus secretin PilQ/predicted competence protein
MFASKRGGRGRLWALIVAGSISAALGILACATAQAPDSADAGTGSPESNVLRDVWVEREGDASVVTLVGLQDPVYTAFLHSDPTALVVDLPSTEVEGPDAPVSVYDGLVDQVSVSSFGDDDAGNARVEISLASWADYDIVSTPEGLSLRLYSAPGDEPEAQAPAAPEEMPDEADAAAEEDPWAQAPSLAGEEAGDSQPMTMEQPPATPATALSGVEVTPAAPGVLLHMVADGAIESTESFVLENPARLVIDLPGLQNAAPKARVAVGGDLVSSVRVGAHPDKVRVVVDGGPAADGFEGRRLVPAANGLFVTLGQGEALDEALAAALADAQPLAAAEPAAEEGADAMAQETAPEEGAPEALSLADAEAPDESVAEEREERFPKADAASVVVHGIHFDSQADKDRIVVLAEGPLEYELHTPDPETAILSIFDATIPKQAEGRITPPLGGPVSLITAFRQPDVERREVRIVVKRARDSEPEVQRHGSLIFMDFPNTGTAANAPPAFPGPKAVLSTEDGPQQMAGAEGEATSSASSPPGFDLAEAPASDASQSQAGAPPAATAGSELPQFSQPASLSGAASLDQQAVPASLSGAAPPASLEPPAAVDMLQEGGLIDGKEYKGRRISLDFKDVEIADVLRIIAEVSDLNIVAGEEVEGTVTIRLVDVPWDQALDVILLTKGLGFVRVGSVLRIAPADILQQEEEVRLQERRNKEKLEDLVVKLQPVNYASVKDAEALVKKLLSARGTVNVDQRTNTLIIKDIAAVVDEATALIKAIDTQTPQVVIEAKIVEANLDFSRELGAFWSFATNPLKNGFDDSSDPRENLGDRNSFLFHDNNSVVFANPITSIPTGLATLNAFLLDQKFDLGVQLAAAESSGDGKVISSPRVVTLDNREAEIKQGVSIPFQTFENGDAKLEFIDAVLRLKVTPHITSDRSIIMLIEVQRNAPDDTVSTPTGSPAIAKNEAKTETLVKDGQTLVIGGIYTVTKTQRESRVPYLHTIPVLGNIFKSREITDLRKELLIFVTPRVVVQPS